MVQSNINRSVISPDIDGYAPPHGRTSPAGDIPANGQPLGQAQLLDYLQRSLAGEPFPVSAPQRSPAAEEALPLALRIREILRAEQENERAAAEQGDGASSMPLAAPAPPATQPPAASPLIALAPFAPAPAPSVDKPRRLPSSIGWGSAAFVLLIAVGGTCIPGIVAAPPRFAADARLQLLGAARTTPGFLEATALRLSSPRLLSQVVTRLKLDRDAEFNGGKATSYSVIMDLFTDSGAAADSFSRAQLALQQRLTVTPDRLSGDVTVSVQSADPKKSARIANLLADIAVRDAAAKPFASAPSETELVLENDRKRYDATNAALAAFKATAGDDKIAAATDLMQRKDGLNSQIAAAASASQAASIHLSAAKAVRMADVLDGSISPDLGSPAALEDLRNRYAAARSTLGQLSTQLGPRHPRLLAVQATIDSLSAAILAEIQKIVIASDAEVKTTAAQVKQLKARLADLDQQTVDVDLVALGRLQTNVEAARQAYESALTAPEEARPSTTAAELPLALATPAVTPAAPLDDNLVGRTLFGALGGIALGLALLACRKLIDRLFRTTPFDEDAMDFDMVDLLATVPHLETATKEPLDTPQQRFNAAIAVANDRSAKAADTAPEEPDPVLTAIIGDVAELRAKVATYVSQRQAAGR